jgi:hypothetical protein
MLAASSAGDVPAVREPSVSLAAQGQVGEAQVQRAGQRDVVGLEDPEDLHERSGLPAQVVGLIVVGQVELRWRQPVHESASLPVDLVIVRGGIDENDELARITEFGARWIGSHHRLSQIYDPATPRRSLAAGHRETSLLPGAKRPFLSGGVVFHPALER